MMQSTCPDQFAVGFNPERPDFLAVLREPLEHLLDLVARSGNELFVVGHQVSLEVVRELVEPVHVGLLKRADRHLPSSKHAQPTSRSSLRRSWISSLIRAAYSNR